MENAYKEGFSVVDFLMNAEGLKILLDKKITKN
jgi:hypothetical protein